MEITSIHGEIFPIQINGCRCVHKAAIFNRNSVHLIGRANDIAIVFVAEFQSLKANIVCAVQHNHHVNTCAVAVHGETKLVTCLVKIVRWIVVQCHCVFIHIPFARNIKFLQKVNGAPTCFITDSSVGTVHGDLLFRRIHAAILCSVRAVLVRKISLYPKTARRRPARNSVIIPCEHTRLGTASFRYHICFQKRADPQKSGIGITCDSLWFAVQQ